MPDGDNSRSRRTAACSPYELIPGALAGANRRGAAQGRLVRRVGVPAAVRPAPFRGPKSQGRLGDSAPLQVRLSKKGTRSPGMDCGRTLPRDHSADGGSSCELLGRPNRLADERDRFDLAAGDLLDCRVVVRRDAAVPVAPVADGLFRHAAGVRDFLSLAPPLIAGEFLDPIAEGHHGDADYGYVL